MMSPEPIITVSGLRGVVGESLTDEVAARYAMAFASTLPEGSLVISNDARSSAPQLQHAISAALASAGRAVYIAGPAATPTLGVLVREQKCIGGIQISASHNPAQYNGMKLFSSAGRVLPADAGAKVLSRYRQLQNEPPAQDSSTSAPVNLLDDALSTHCQLVLQTVNVEQIRAKSFRVLIDANHGAGGPLAVRLLQELGCQVVELGTQPDAKYEHPLEPTEDNLKTVLRQVQASRCDIGFCQDPDADRLAVIDQAGRYLGEELTLALCVDHRLRQRVAPVVVNCSSSRVTEDLANKYGAPYFRSKVGEANVVDLMLAEDAILGGEGNGGVIDPRVGLVRDSFVGIAMILDAMSQRDLTVGQLADELPKYEIVKSKVDMPGEEMIASFARLKSHFSAADSSELDGLRFDWPGRWLLVRASNTEPIVRVIAEAESRLAAAELCQETTAVLHGSA